MPLIYGGGENIKSALDCKDNKWFSATGSKIRLLIGNINNRKKEELEKIRWLYTITNDTSRNLEETRKALIDNLGI